MGIYAFFQPSDYITNPSGYSLFAEARFGGNGTFFLPPELAGGSSSEASAYELEVWDTDLSDGLDSGGVALQIDANMDGGTVGLDASTAGSSVLSYDGDDNLGTIGSVLIRAGSTVAGSVTFSDVSVTFWKDGVQQDTVNVGGVAPTRPAHRRAALAEQIVSVTSAVSGCDRVTVSGVVRLQAGAGVIPAGPTCSRRS